MQTHGLAVDVVVCVHNALEYASPCIASVLSTLGESSRLIVVDDASEQDVIEHLRQLSARDKRVFVQRNPQRSGYTKAANIGLRLSSADLVILLNSDTLVPPRWIYKLWQAAFSSESVGIVGPLSNAANLQSIPDNRLVGLQTAINPLPPGWSVSDMDAWCESQAGDVGLPHVPILNGFCLGITRATINTLGFFDEVLFPHGYGEETDYCLRAGNAGIALVVATHTYVYHAKTKSYDSAERERLVIASSKALRSRHGSERVNIAIRELEENPYLSKMRRKAATLY